MEPKTPILGALLSIVGLRDNKKRHIIVRVFGIYVMLWLGFSFAAFVYHDLPWSDYKKILSFSGMIASIALLFINFDIASEQEMNDEDKILEAIKVKRERERARFGVWNLLRGTRREK